MHTTFRALNHTSRDVKLYTTHLDPPVKQCHKLLNPHPLMHFTEAPFKFFD